MGLFNCVCMYEIKNCIGIFSVLVGYYYYMYSCGTIFSTTKLDI